MIDLWSGRRHGGHLLDNAVYLFVFTFLHPFTWELILLFALGMLWRSLK